MILKVLYPGDVTFLRGYYDSEEMNKDHTLYDESWVKYGNLNLWKKANTMFQLMPVAALIEDSVFTVHALTICTPMYMP